MMLFRREQDIPTVFINTRIQLLSHREEKQDEKTMLPTLEKLLDGNGEILDLTSLYFLHLSEDNNILSIWPKVGCFLHPGETGAKHMEFQLTSHSSHALAIPLSLLERS